MEQEKLTNQKETIIFLSKKYPQCFFIEGQVKPLKIGIFQDLAKDLGESEVVSKRLLRMSLRHYTSSWRYLSAVKKGVARIDLNGNEGELVEEQHAEHAAEQLKESKARAAKLREKRKPAKSKTYQSKSTKNTAEKNNPPNKAKSSQHSGKANRAKQPEELKVDSQIADTEVVVGNSALVKLGREPMAVVITDVAKDGIAVQLKSGMTVKVQKQQLYSVAKAKTK